MLLPLAYSHTLAYSLPPLHPLPVASMYHDELFDVFRALKDLQPTSIKYVRIPGCLRPRLASLTHSISHRSLSHKVMDFPYMCAVPEALFEALPVKTLMWVIAD